MADKQLVGIQVSRLSYRGLLQHKICWRTPALVWGRNPGSTLNSLRLLMRLAPTAGHWTPISDP